jgi:hypothetical protein
MVNPNMARRICMEQALIVNSAYETVRFTPDGKMAVVYAIRAVCDSSCPGAMWETMKTEHPEVLICCEDNCFPIDDFLPVVDSEGWESILGLLPEYLLDKVLA